MVALVLPDKYQAGAGGGGRGPGGEREERGEGGGRGCLWLRKGGREEGRECAGAQGK